jgi:hypothetical protein
MALHVFGDSHSEFFARLPGVHIHHIKAKTMYGLCKETAINGKPFDVREFGVEKGDITLYVFGEIDVRTHLGRIRDTQKIPQEKLLDDLVKNFLELVKTNATLSGAKVILSSVVPPSDLTVNPNYPYYGTLEDRVQLQKELNRRLSLAGYPYLDYAHLYSKSDGSIDHRYSDGHVHLRPEYSDRAISLLFKVLKFV